MKEQQSSILPVPESAVVSTLLYFDMFSHPLTLAELAENIKVPLSEHALAGTLAGLEANSLVFRIDGFYALRNDPAIVRKRLAGNALAEVFLKRAGWVSRFVSWFPFVRGVIISGSLSKHYMDRDSDIDFFIVTAEGRLWVCRSMLAVWRKLMIGPLRKYFCINYFISLDALAIPDRNLFTATELVFMYPTYGKNVYHRIMEANDWVKTYYPNKPLRSHPVNDRQYPASIKRLAEWALSGRLGERMDTALFRLMLNRWKKRYKDEFDETQFDLNIRTKKNVSKQHEKGHQFLLLEKYRKQIGTFERTHGVTLFHG